MSGFFFCFMRGAEMLSMLRAQYGLSQWALVFFLYSFVGWCWEVLLYLVRQRRMINRGFLRGPFLPVYGFGALGMLLVCLPVKESVGKVAIVGSITACILEYAAGALMLRVLHVRYWDYRGQRMNLGGHVCLMSALTWAVFAVVVVCVLHPLFQPSLRKIPPMLCGVLSGALAVFALGDTARQLWPKRRMIAAGLKRHAET